MSGKNGTAPKKPAGSEASQESRKPPRSLEELKQLIEANPTADFELSATELMMLMESPRREFCSTPPSQQASLMDADERDDIRVVGCLWQHTTRGGDGTRGRCPFGRNPDGTAMKRVHVGQKLSLKGAKLNAAVDLAIAKKRVREDEKGRLWVCGSVPEPRVQVNGRTKGVGLCTKSTSIRLTQRLQQLAEKEKTIFENRRSRLDDAEDQAIAEATAQVREAFAPLHEQLLATIDLKPVTLKKRRHETPRKEPQLKVTLQLKFPEFDFVQTRDDSPDAHFVQTENPTLYRPKNESVQTAQPYRKESKSNRVSECSPDSEQEADQIPTHPENALLQNVLAANGFPLAETDPLLPKFAALADEHAIPIRSLCSAIANKVARKARGSIFSAGALYEYLSQDLRTWIAQNREDIQIDEHLPSHIRVLRSQVAEAEAYWRQSPEDEKRRAELAQMRSLLRREEEYCGIARSSSGSQAQKAGQP